MIIVGNRDLRNVLKKLKLVNMLKIKVSCNGYPSTTIKDEQGFTSISKFLPQGKNIWKGCQFFVNEDVKDPDYWIVIDDIGKDKEFATIRKDRVFFCTDEVPFVTFYFDDTKFLDQFYKVISPHPVYNHNNVESALSLTPITINTVYGESLFKYDPVYNYDNMIAQDRVEKTKTLSIIASSKGAQGNNMTDFHKIRYHFAQRLKEHFKDKIDLYGYGYNEIKNRADAIVPYKYHVCLENQSTYNIITEKLYASYLALSYPIYWGAPNITDFFPKESITSMNILDFKGSVQAIEKVLEEDPYDDSLPFLVKAKNDVLNKYSTFQRISTICEDDNKARGQNDIARSEVVVQSRDSFIVKESKRKKKIKNIMKYSFPSIVAYEVVRQLFF